VTREGFIDDDEGEKTVAAGKDLFGAEPLMEPYVAVAVALVRSAL
jgi:hypothetical protein